MSTHPERNIDSLPAHQVKLLLRTIKIHGSHLSMAHEDALRWARDGTRPAYLVDFDLLYQYAFGHEENPEGAVELEYLVDQRDVTFIIGPGTHIEIDRATKMIRRMRRGFARTTDLRREEEQLERLLEVLQAPNLVPYDQYVPDDTVDIETFELVKATLQRSRRLTTDHANEADALNSAAVIHMRRCSKQLGLRFFPYLLTGTAPLLRDQALGLEEEEPLSREPASAIYSDVLFRTMPEGEDAVQHTSDMELLGATLQHRLRQSPGYRDPGAYADDPNWEKAIADERVAEDLRDQLRALSSFVDDPIVYQTQRIYESAQRSATNLAQQHQVGNVDRFESPRRLFELITGISRALEAGASSDRRLSGLWNTVLELTETRDGALLKYDLRDRGRRSGKSPYFSVEVHPSPDGEVADFYVLRWPGSADAESLIEEFQRAFRRHQVGSVDLAIGTSRGVYEFEAEFPTSVMEMSLALESAVTDERGAQRMPVDIDWFRMDSEDLDLFADVSNPPERDAIVGVFIGSPNSEHVAELHERTAARYLFPAWLGAAMQQIMHDVAEFAREAHRRPQGETND